MTSRFFRSRSTAASPAQTSAPVRRRKAGFSLVEVALAVGIVGFGMTVIMGVLPVGLASVKDSKLQSAKANISRQLRGEFQQISFKDNTVEQGARTIDTLSGEEFFYAQDGTRVATPAEAYYSAEFEVNQATGGGTEFGLSNACSVVVTLTYPYIAPELNREKAKFSLFVARQRGI